MEYNQNAFIEEAKDELDFFNKIKESYLTNKEVIEKNRESAFSPLKELLRESLIDDLFNEYIYSRLNKIICIEREKGYIIYIDIFDFKEIYKSHKNHFSDIKNMFFQEFYDSKIKRVSLKAVFASKIKRMLETSLEEFYLRVSSLSESEEKEYALSEIQYLNSIINRTNEILLDIQESDRVYYRLAISQISEKLKNIILDYFNIISPALKKQLKKRFPSLVTFLDGKTLISSFSSEVEEYKINNLRYELKKRGFIDPIDSNLFLKIFRSEYITERINWRLSKSELYFFVKTLLKKEYISTRNDIWKKTAHCFTHKHLDIDTKAMRHQTKPCKSKQENILKIF